VFFATTSNRTYPYDPAVSNVPPYIVRTGGDVQAIAVGLSDADGSGHPDEVYVGGHFTQFQEPAKATRPKIGSFSYDTGLPTSWAPVIDSYYGVWAMTATPDYLVVGGPFTTVDGVAQRGIARFAGTP
jgi:hypothetical protein